MKTLVIIISCMIICINDVMSQNVNGKVVNRNQQPVEALTVVMQSEDSVFVDAVITDAQGRFVFDTGLKSFRLIFQHILYETVSRDFNEPNVGVITMKEQNYSLDEVVIKGERPLVKAENGLLSYDVSVIAEKSSVSNAYEAVTRLPGVMEQDGGLQLVGAGSPTIILNGRPSSMTAEQLVNLLKNTPVSNVEKAEVMYSAPAKYRVRGAVINIVLKKNKSEEPLVRGEIGGNYTQGIYSSAGGNMSLSFSGEKLSADILYSADYSKKRTSYDFISHHTLGNKVYEISQYNIGLRQGLTHNMRASLDYHIADNHNLNVAYTSAISPDIKSTENSKGTLSESSNIRKGDEQMHNVSADYTSDWGTNIGLDYTYYSYPSVQDFTNKSSFEVQKFKLNSSQYVNRWNVYAGQTNELPNEWSVNYGINFSFANEKSLQKYNPMDGNDMSDMNSSSSLKEETYNFYGGFEKSFNERLSLSMSLAGEYYRLAGYTDWSVYPTMQLSYVPSAAHIFQLSFSSDKTYPDYWDIQNSVSYLNGYSKAIGNPQLRPSKDYTADLTYVLKSKYMFSIHYTHVKDLFAQLAYQSPDELIMIYQPVNFDYQQNFGISAVIPFVIGQFWNSRITLDASYFRDVCRDYHDIGFDNSVWRGVAMMNNTFTLSSKPAISLELNAMYVSPSIQGNYDLSSICKVDAGLKWVFANRNAELRLTGNDLFNTATPNAYVNDRGQHFEIKQHADSRYVSMSFTYRFGGFKSKERKKVDTSRFGY